MLMNAVAKSSKYWIAPGQSVHLHGYDLGAGLFYLGGPYRFAVDRQLPVAEPSYSPQFEWGQDVTYHGLSASCRAGYLQWLADGRTKLDNVPSQFFKLFHYGLEYRMFVEGDLDNSLPGAVIELLQTYPVQAHSLPCLKFLHCWGRLSGDYQHCALFSEVLPDIIPSKYLQHDLSDLRLLAASLAADQLPLKDELAYQFVIHHPKRHPRTGHFSNDPKLKDDFCRRFTNHFSSGFQLKPAKTFTEYHYPAASPEVRQCISQFWNCHIPDAWESNNGFADVVGIWNQLVDDEVIPTLPWTEKPPASNLKKERLLREDTEATHAFLAARLAETDVRRAPLNQAQFSTMPPGNLVSNTPATARHHNLGSVLRELAQKTQWPWLEFEALARRHSWLPWGLYEALNEWSVDHFEDYLLSGKETIQINSQLINQIRSHKQYD